MSESLVHPKAAEVLRLHLTEGQGIRAISTRLGVSRKTVRKVLGKVPVAAQKASHPRESMFRPFEEAVRQMLDDEPSIRATAVLERLRPKGYHGGITVIRDGMRKLRPPPEREAFLTLDFVPGEVSQVDWADFGYAIPGCPRRVSAFVMVLAYSRYLYLEFTLSQAMGSFLRCMERGLSYFGGTCETDVFDNMKTVVLRHQGKEVTFNPRFLEYARNRGFGVRACNVRRANEKGRVERPIGFVRERFWPGRRFSSLLDLNVQAAAWRDDVANNRVHAVTGKVPALVFKHDEQPRLRPIPEHPFNTDEVEGHSVTKSFRVRFDRNLYSVPPRLVGQSVLVRATEQTVTVFLGPKAVATHERCWDVGRDIEAAEHREAAIAQKSRQDSRQLPAGLEHLGDVGAAYLKILAAGHRSLARELRRLVFLVESFGPTATSRAMSDVMTTGHVGAEYVEYTLRHRQGLQPAIPLLRLGNPEFDGITFAEPDLSRYDALFPAPRLLDPGLPPDEVPSSTESTS